MERLKTSKGEATLISRYQVEPKNMLQLMQLLNQQSQGQTGQSSPGGSQQQVQTQPQDIVLTEQLLHRAIDSIDRQIESRLQKSESPESIKEHRQQGEFLNELHRVLRESGTKFLIISEDSEPQNFTKQEKWNNDYAALSGSKLVHN